MFARVHCALVLTGAVGENMYVRQRAGDGVLVNPFECVSQDLEPG